MRLAHVLFACWLMQNWPFCWCSYYPCVMFCVCLCLAGCCISVSAGCCGLVQGGCWDSYGEEIQQCPVWRYCILDCIFYIKELSLVSHCDQLNKEAGVIGLTWLLFNLTYRFDRVTVFAAAVSVITCNRCSVRPSWQKTPAHSYNSEFWKKPHSRALNNDSLWPNWVFVFQLGLMSSYAVWAVSQSFSMFLLFRVIGGICKGNVSLCTAIIADLPSLKARNRGMVGVDFCGHYKKSIVDCLISP